MNLEPDPKEASTKGPIFIVGCQRSGTSVLWNALRSHPNLLLPENCRETLRGLDPKELWFVREWMLGRQAIPQKEHQGSPLDRLFQSRLARLIDEFSREHFAGPGGRWVSGHPADGLYVREILENFPDSRVLFLDRHPQEVVWSSLHTRWSKLDTRRQFLDAAKKAARHWRQFAVLSVDVLEGRLGPRVLVVRHERILSEPGSVARECLDHVDEPFDPAVEKALGFVFNSSFHENSADPQEIVRARDKIAADAEICDLVVRETFELMEKLGYQDLRADKDASAAPGMLGGLRRYFRKARQ